MGYHHAGFEVVGVDINPQPHYPFEFHRADALEFVREHGHEFDAIHASPPCHDYTSLAGRTGSDGTGWLLPATRATLSQGDKPWVIENVEGAAMRADLTLCGSMFGLSAAGLLLVRHRLFESNASLRPPGPDRCAGKPVAGVYGGGPQNYANHHRGGRGVKFNAVDARIALGIDWMTKKELNQAIPPAYTEYLGRQLMAQLEGREVA